MRPQPNDAKPTKVRDVHASCEMTQAADQARKAPVSETSDADRDRATILEALMRNQELLDHSAGARN